MPARRLPRLLSRETSAGRSRTSIWEGDGTTIVSPPAAQPMPDVMEDLLAMVGLGESAGVGQDAEEFFHTPTPATAATSPSITCTCAYASVIGDEAIRGTFHGLAEAGIASRRLIINDAKALVHTVNDTAYLVSPGVPTLCAGASRSGRACQAGESTGLAVDAEALRQLQLHRKHPNGLNIWTQEVTGRGSPADCMATSWKMGPWHSRNTAQQSLSCSDSEG